MKYRFVMQRGWYHVEKYEGFILGWSPIDSCGETCYKEKHHIKEFLTYQEVVAFAREMFGSTGKLVSKGVVL